MNLLKNSNLIFVNIFISIILVISKLKHQKKNYLTGETII